MASGALFGTASGRAQTRHLVEFKAGKMYMKGNTVHPDKRKGLVYVYQSEDSLMHFCWKDRSKTTAEEDFIIFPDDCNFKKIPAPTNGRIVLLRFKSSGKKHLYWMQDANADGDAELCRKVTETLTNPPARSSSSNQLAADLAAGIGGDTDLNSLLGNMSQQQLLQLLGGMGGMGGGLSSLLGGRPSSTQSDSSPPSRIQSSPGSRPSQSTESSAAPPRPTTAAAMPSGASQAVQLQDLQNILSGLASLPGNEPAEPRTPVDLMLGLTPERLLPILANPEVQTQLLPHLPEGEEIPKTEAELRATIRTPQFRQAVQSLVAALSTGQLGPLMRQFGLGEAAVNAANTGDVEAFIRAMQEEENSK